MYTMVIRMDPLTHAATGLFLSRAGLNRLTPRATPILVLAALAPDVDIVSAAGGSLAYLHYHRHLTHALIAAPVLAALAIAVVRLAGRKSVRWVGAFAAALVAVGSHLLLDLTNSYGIRLFLPFSSEWRRLDLTSVIDLWIWAALLLGIMGPVIGRLVGSEISSGSSRVKHYGRGFAWFALLFILLYDCGRGVAHARAAAILNSRIYGEAEPLRVAALPDPVNLLRWSGVVETQYFYAVEEVDLAGDFDPTRASIYHKADPDAALEAARRTRTFQEFLQFSEFPIFRISAADEPENGKVVEALDMRFGTPLDPRFVASALLNANERVLSTSFQFGSVRLR